MKYSKHIVILTPGFPKNEQDTTCIPPLQAYVENFTAIHPEIKMSIISFQYPFFKLFRLILALPKLHRIGPWPKPKYLKGYTGLAETAKVETESPPLNSETVHRYFELIQKENFYASCQQYQLWAGGMPFMMVTKPI